jgi:ELWxxDGT repeat protein
MKRYLRPFFLSAAILVITGMAAQAQPTFVTEVPSGSANFTPIGDLVYFTNRHSLWRTDGTSAGTFVLQTVTWPGSFRELNGDLIFTARPSETSVELWRSDGTPTGTIKLLDVQDLSYLDEAGEYLYFTASTPESGREIYRTNGTPGGTILLKDINPGAADGIPDRALYRSYIPHGVAVYPSAPVGTEMFFGADNGINGVELWKTDGSAVGTMMVKDINPGSADGFTPGIVSGFEGHFYFTGSDPTIGPQPWVSDGTADGTHLFTVMEPAPDNGLEFRIAHNGWLYMMVGTSTSLGTQFSLWKTDGTAASTLKVKDLCMDCTFDSKILTYNDKLYFFLYVMYGTEVLWETDGTAEGTQQRYSEFLDGNIPFFARANHHIFFSTTSQGYSIGLYALDANDGTVKFIWPYKSNALYSQREISLAAVGDLVFFADHTSSTDGNGNTEDPDDTYQLLQTDGDTVTAVRDIYGISMRGSYDVTNFNGKVLFTRQNDYTDPAEQKHLWIYDPNGAPANNGTFTLVNADTDQDIRTLQDGEVITKAGSENISIRYNPAGTPGSVAFTLNGSRVRLENAAPYSLAGDTGGNYNPWTGAAPGSYTLTATPYSGSGGGGTAGTPLTIHFAIEGSGECTASGTILREYWSGIQGNTVDQIPVNSPPQSTSQLTLFEGPTNAGTNYGARVRGYICPPVTGDYTFWIASNDHSELWLSSDDDPSTKRRIASVTGATNPRQWDKYATQKSALIHLTTGKRYYIEALHKQGVGTDNLAVGWQLPDATMERPIPGSRLSPFINGSPANHGTFTLVNADTDEDIMTMQDGDAITKTESENINIRFNPAGTPGSIVFTLNGSRVRTENAAPYSLGGDSSGDYAAWNGAVPGSYALTATPYSGSGGGGTAGPSSTIHFSIESGATAARVASDQSAAEEEAVFSQISIYPNPARSGDSQLSVSGYGGIQRPVATSIEIIDLTGEVIYSEMISCGGDCASYLLNFNKQLAPGLYLVNMNTNGSKVSKRLLVK